MIKFLLISNNQAKLRLSRFFGKHNYTGEKQRELIKACLKQSKQEGLIETEEDVVVYRVFANLIFILAITEDENELAALEFLLNFVETMQKYFEKISEMDLLFNMDRVHMILDEMISNGCVSETNRNRILVPLNLMDAAKK